jgi:hypothetical protein
MIPTAVTTLLDDYNAAWHEQQHGADLDARRAAHVEVIRLGGEIATHGIFVFNGDYHDLAQIVPFIEDYWTIYEELVAASKRPTTTASTGESPDSQAHCHAKQRQSTCSRSSGTWSKDMTCSPESLRKGTYGSPSSPSGNATRQWSCSTSSTAHSDTSRHESHPTRSTSRTTYCRRADEHADGDSDRSTRCTSWPDAASTVSTRLA